MEKENMKKASVLIVVAFILGFVIGYAINQNNETKATAQFQTNQKILQNSGFENNIEGELAYWFKAYIPENNITMTYDTQTTYNGSRSVSIKKTANTEINDESVNNNWAQTISLVPIDRIVELSGYVKTENAETVVMVIQCWDENSNMAGFATTESKDNITGTSDWTKYRTSVRVPVETQHITVRLVLVGTGQVWFDDVTLVVK